MTQLKKDNINKKEISKKIVSSTGLPLNFIESFIEQLFIYLIDELTEKKSIKIKNFGVLKLTFKKKRIGINPKDVYKEYLISARYVVQYKASENLKILLNKNEEF